MSELVKLRRDDERDLRFSGELLAEAETSPERAYRNFSGSTGRWAELKLYKTAAGKFVLSRAERTQWQNEVDRYSAVVCDDEEALCKAAGNSRLAKSLLAHAGIECVQEVE